MKSTVFWDITPYSPLKVNRRFGGIYRLVSCSDYSPTPNMEASCLLPALTLVSWSGYSSGLKMEAKYSFQTSVDFQWTTRHDIPEDSITTAVGISYFGVINSFPFLNLPRGYFSSFSFRQWFHWPDISISRADLLVSYLSSADMHLRY
jgi:hypothetical protein